MKHAAMHNNKRQSEKKNRMLEENSKIVNCQFRISNQLRVQRFSRIWAPLKVFHCDTVHFYIAED